MPDSAAVAALLDRLYIAAAGAGLRDEDRKKAAELAPLLGEIERAVAGSARSRPLVLVDAAAGKGYVGLCAAELVLAPAERSGTVVVLEREERRAAAGRAAAAGSLRRGCPSTSAPVTWPTWPAGRTRPPWSSPFTPAGSRRIT